MKKKITFEHSRHKGQKKSKKKMNFDAFSLENGEELSDTKVSLGYLLLVLLEATLVYLGARALLGRFGGAPAPSSGLWRGAGEDLNRYQFLGGPGQPRKQTFRLPAGAKNVILIMTGGGAGGSYYPGQLCSEPGQMRTFFLGDLRRDLQLRIHLGQGGLPEENGGVTVVDAWEEGGWRCQVRKYVALGGEYLGQDRPVGFAGRSSATSPRCDRQSRNPPPSSPEISRSPGRPLAEDHPDQVSTEGTSTFFCDPGRRTSTFDHLEQTLEGRPGKDLLPGSVFVQEEDLCGVTPSSAGRSGSPGVPAMPPEEAPGNGGNGAVLILWHAQFE